LLQWLRLATVQDSAHGNGISYFTRFGPHRLDAHNEFRMFLRNGFYFTSGVYSRRKGGKDNAE
jgi:hypothetical protein